jgi:phage repressor protein C with HTH and peptisase S24 domain
MVPTLKDGDAVLVRRGGRPPRPGDVVIGQFRSRPDLLVLKRVVRRAGDAWWLQGDNALSTDDSRTYGVADVTGRIILQWWPRLRRL